MIRYPLVNVDITNWKDFSCYEWDNQLFRLGHFQERTVKLPDGIHIFQENGTSPFKCRVLSFFSIDVCHTKRLYLWDEHVDRQQDPLK